MLLERKSGLVFIRKVAHSTAVLTCDALKSMLSVNNEHIKAVEQAINSRPRKRLGYKVPIEFIGQLIDFSTGCAVNA